MSIYGCFFPQLAPKKTIACLKQWTICEQVLGFPIFERNPIWIYEYIVFALVIQCHLCHVQCHHKSPLNRWNSIQFFEAMKVAVTWCYSSLFTSAVTWSQHALSCYPCLQGNIYTKIHNTIWYLYVIPSDSKCNMNKYNMLVFRTPYSWPSTNKIIHPQLHWSCQRNISQWNEVQMTHVPATRPQKTMVPSWLLDPWLWPRLIALRYGNQDQQQHTMIVGNKQKKAGNWGQFHCFSGYHFTANPQGAIHVKTFITASENNWNWVHGRCGFSGSISDSPVPVAVQLPVWSPKQLAVG